MTRPEDLPDFGNIPGYVPDPDAPKIIVPPSVTKDDPIEVLETPDQLEAEIVHGKDWTDDDDSLVPKAVTDRVLSAGEREELITIREPGEVDYAATHPDYEPTLDFQILMYHDMIRSARWELRDINKRINNLEIQLDFYPETTGRDEITEMRHAIVRQVEVENEILHYSNQIQLRIKAMNTVDTDGTPIKPSRKSFFERSQNSLFRKIFKKQDENY